MGPGRSWGFFWVNYESHLDVELQTSLKRLFSRLSSIAKRHELVTAYAAIFAVIVGVCSVIVAQRQLAESMRLQQQTIAEESFREYLKLAIEKPEFAEGLPVCSTNDCKNPKDSYGWFVAYFLHAAEQIYLVYPKKEGWRNALIEHICHHQKYLASDDVSTTSYDPSFVEFASRSLQECGAKQH